VVGERRTGLSENGRSITELLADHAEAKEGPPLFEELQRREELLGVLVVLPACGPEYPQRTRRPHAACGHRVDSRWENKGLPGDAGKRVQKGVIRHAPQENFQGLQKGIPVEG
jgi:hypothetical protein